MRIFSHAKFSLVLSVVLLAVSPVASAAGLGLDVPLPSSGVVTVPPLPPSMVGASGGAIDAGKGVSGPVASVGALNIKPGSHIDLRFTAVSQIVDLVYAEMLQRPYVLCPELLADNRIVSFRYDRAQGDVRDFMLGFLASLGYKVAVRDGVDYVLKRGDDEVAQAEAVTLVYRPVYRDADYLARLVQPLFKGRFVQNRAVAAPEGAKSSGDVPPSSAAALVDQSSDVLVFSGSADEIGKLKKVLAQLDTAQGQVVLRAWVYEVSTDVEKSSAFQLAASILGGRLGVSFGLGTIAQGANALTISAGSLSAAISALDSDSRFHIVTSPNVMVASGKHARLNMGQSVPVVSSVSYPGSTGVPVQSVSYQDAGVIFDVQPTVKGDVIDTDVTIEISNFQNTTTGVNQSPTKNTRKTETTMDLQDGQVVVMGGLTQGNQTVSRSGVGWLPNWMSARSASDTKSDVVLVMQVSKM